MVCHDGQPGNDKVSSCMEVEYPVRPQMYALKYLRWLIESGTSLEAGPEVFSLLAAVVMQEDRLFCVRAVDFFNEQLCTSSGLATVPRLRRARDRAVLLGLLHYTPGAKRRPAKYFTLGMPLTRPRDTGTKRSSKRTESGKNWSTTIPSPPPYKRTTSKAEARRAKA